MEVFDKLKLFGIVSSFFVLIYILINTYNTTCFDFNQIFITYILLIYTIIVEIFSLIFKSEAK